MSVSANHRPSSPSRPRPERLFRGYIFDLDGTVYLSGRLLPGAGEALARLRRAGAKRVFVSNNPTLTRPEMAAKLARLGVPVDDGEVLNSSLVLVRRLLAEHPGARLFPVSEQPLIDELAAAGFTLTENPQEIDFVVASFDRTFAYPKLQTAFDAIRAGARLIATNADRYCPVEGGGEPDAAAVIAAIEACTGAKLEWVAGKPSEWMARTALMGLGLPPEDVLMVGDRLETDIRMGQRAGMPTALTLTGATPAALLEDEPQPPNYVLDTLADLVAEMGDEG